MGHQPPAPPSLTIDDPLDPPDAQCDDETDSVPGAAGAVGHCGGHHGGQRQHDDSTIKHLRDHAYIHTYKILYVQIVYHRSLAVPCQTLQP